MGCRRWRYWIPSPAFNDDQDFLQAGLSATSWDDSFILPSGQVRHSRIANPGKGRYYCMSDAAIREALEALTTENRSRVYDRMARDAATS